MNYFSPKPLLVGLAMVLAVGLALAMRPSEKIADRAPPVDLESMIPAQFAGWEIDTSIVPVTVSPDVQARLDKIYNKTLSRTYVNSRQERVMLSIAYGGDQSDGLLPHTPEMCYTAQGFQVTGSVLSQVLTDYGVLPVKRLLATQGLRHEPITYWITIGDHVTTSGFQMKLAQLRHGIAGRIPDGMLVRVSTIGRDEAPAYQLQNEFVQALIAALPENQRARVAGVFGA